jgi:hypothetical protein
MGFSLQCRPYLKGKGFYTIPLVRQPTCMKQSNSKYVADIALVEAFLLHHAKNDNGANNKFGPVSNAQ